jgi:uncharacterized protein YPO0396
MKADRELEFIDDDMLAGFRLARIELLNWGTFDKKVWVLTPGGRNVLVTGDIGSGKSTLVDAITTLLVPANKISYNKAAGAETRERTLRSYVLGYYKAERSDAGYGAKPVALRDEKSYSVILGVFVNSGYGQTVTLAQVFWQKEQSGQPDRFYVVADCDLQIIPHFKDFGTDIRELKKRLKTLPHVDDVFDSFPPYAGSFRRRFGIDNDQALELFLQTVSMKTVGNLTDFVRMHMLEAFESEARIQALIAHFDDLNRSHNAVLKAKTQIEKLTPIIKDLDRHREITVVREDMRQCREALFVYFSHIKAGLLEKRIANLEEEHKRCEAKVWQIEELLSAKHGERDKLRQAIAENGGDRLERLKSDISLLMEKKTDRLGKAEDYRKIAGRASIPFDDSMESFLSNRKTISDELALAGERDTELQNIRIEAEVDLRKLRDSHDEIRRELESLRKRKSNIDSTQIRIRSEICLALSISEDEIPFAGELLQVRPEESLWEGAIERLLRNFGLSLIVPEKHYIAVSAWIDKNNCRGRIVYFKVGRKYTQETAELLPNSLVHKLSVKPENDFSLWMSMELARRFDYACTTDLDQFRREKQAITPAGQIKGSGNRHEKDDRHSITDRSRYILGWTNEAKIASLDKQRSELEGKIAEAGAEIGGLKLEQGRISDRKENLMRLDNFASWEEMDWRPVAIRIGELEHKRKELEASSNILASLSSQFNKLELEIKGTQESLDTEKDKRSRNDEKRNQAQELLSQCHDSITGAAIDGYEEIALRLDEFKTEALGELHVTVESADNKQTEMREWLQKKIDNEDKKIKSLEGHIIQNMQNYRRDYVAETVDVDAQLESGTEFRDMLSRLEQDDLPRFESKFKALLNENTIREIANFQSQLNREREIIRERIERINQSLSEIEYNKGRYILLDLVENQDAEIREFRSSLRACTEGSLTGSEEEQYAEEKFLQVKEIIERFRGRENLSDADRRWTRKVTDVRNWYVFAASERWFEDNSEYEHYTDSGGKSGGQKEKLAYTVLAASLAYQFGLEWGEVKSRSFRFVVIDEAFGRGSDESARFGLDLFAKLNLQLLIVTPLQKIHIIEPFVSSVGFVDCPEGKESRLRHISIEQYLAEKKAISE